LNTEKNTFFNHTEFLHIYMYGLAVSVYLCGMFFKNMAFFEFYLFDPMQFNVIRNNCLVKLELFLNYILFIFKIHVQLKFRINLKTTIF